MKWAERLPFKILPLAFVILLWNGLLLADDGFDLRSFIPGFGDGDNQNSEILGPTAPGFRVGLVMVLCLSLGILFVEPIRNIFLKKGRTLEEVAPFVRRLALISGLMLLVPFFLF